MERRLRTAALIAECRQQARTVPDRLEFCDLQAMVRAKLVRTPLYAYSQLQAGRGVQKQSGRGLPAAASAQPGRVSFKEKDALKWFGGLDGRRAKAGGSRRLSVAAPRAVRKSF